MEDKQRKMVVVKTVDGEFVMGDQVAASSNSPVKLLYIKDALCVDYRIDQETFIPVVYFYKYCLYNLSYDVVLNQDHILNIFYDPLPYIVRQYDLAIKKYRENENIVEKAGQPRSPGNNIYNLFKSKDGDDENIH